MKRWIGTLVLAGLAGLVMAQAPFTIVRPADGSKVREQVKVLVPKNSLQGGYVGVFLNGKFVEAVVPPLKGKYYEYTLDTKGRNIPDGPATLELVLYVDFNGAPRIVDRSSVKVNVSNTANIPMPPDGIKLRYHFNSGTQYTYDLLQRVAISTISAAQNKLGGKAAELPLDYEKLRMLYAVDNQYGNGDGLVRMQPLPPVGKHEYLFTPPGKTKPETFSEEQVLPVYMRLTNTGSEVFGSMPVYVPIQGSPSFNTTDLVADYPLPTLPTKAVKPGDVWQTRFQMGKLDLANPANVQTVVQSFPARGEFLGVEWEMGHPCAKIKHTIAVATESTEAQKLKKQGTAFSGDRVQLDETIWFALDKGMVIKVIRNETIDQKVQGAAVPGGGTRGTGPGGKPGPQGGSSIGGGGMGAPGMTKGGWTNGAINDKQGSFTGGKRGGQGGKGGMMPGRPGMGGGGMGAPGMTNGNGGTKLPNTGNRSGNSGDQAQFVRIAIQDIFILDQS